MAYDRVAGWRRVSPPRSRVHIRFRTHRANSSWYNRSLVLNHAVKGSAAVRRRVRPYFFYLLKLLRDFPARASFLPNRGKQRLAERDLVFAKRQPSRSDDDCFRTEKAPSKRLRFRNLNSSSVPEAFACNRPPRFRSIKTYGTHAWPNFGSRCG
jgi:hypothetical protein